MAMINRFAMAGHAIVCAVVCALFLSGAAMNTLGLNYSADASGWGLKLHPYTLATAVAAALLCGSAPTRRRCMQDRTFRVAMTGATVTMAVLLSKAAWGGSQSLGFVIDSLVAAFLVAAVLPFVPSRAISRLSSLLSVFLVCECVLAIAEAAGRFNVIPIDEWYGVYFRATSLHGHPLNNALVVVTVASLLQTYVRMRVSVCIFALSASALIAFGARGALFIYLLVNVMGWVRFGLGSARRVPLLLVGVVLAGAGLAGLISSGVVGSRIGEVGVFDRSSAVRVQSIEMLGKLDISQLLLGVTSSELTRLTGLAGIGVVENFFVTYLLMFGLLLTAAIVYCVHRTLKAQLDGVERSCRKRLLAVLVVFICTAATNNSLATKTPVLYLLVVGLWCARSRMPAAATAAASLTPRKPV
jgi:hypothetical protein